MIKGTMVNFACNSGAVTGEIIGIFRDRGHRKATIGSVVKIAVKSVVPNNPQGIRKGDLLFAVVVRVRQVVNYGSFNIRFSDNAVVAIQGNGDMIGTNVNRQSAPFRMDDPRAMRVEKFLRGKIINPQSDFSLLPGAAESGRPMEVR
jgi:ribosomal protein L14